MPNHQASREDEVYFAVHEVDPEDLGIIYTYETKAAGYMPIGEFMVGASGHLTELFTQSSMWYRRDLPSGQGKTVISASESFAGLMREVRAWAQTAASREQTLTEMGLNR